MLPLKKSTLILAGNHYNHPRTNLLVFHFTPPAHGISPWGWTERASIDGKEIYIIDQFLSENEGLQMREFSRQATFSRPSYGSPEGIERGEKPARSMDSRERWTFFAHSPPAMQQVYQWLSSLAERLNAEITTLPWDLCHSGNSSPAVIANLLEEASPESMEWGKHKDCDPERGIFFKIPVLYESEESFHPCQFINGERGRPWLVSVMLYVTEAGFEPHYRLGTVFYQADGAVGFTCNCLHTRLVLFESDLPHSIEASVIPPHIKTWRVSYVLKLIVNPKSKNSSAKEDFAKK